MTPAQVAALRSLPSVGALLTNEMVRTAGQGLLPEIVTAVARAAQDAVRRDILAGDHSAVERLLPALERELRVLCGAQTTNVINGTGVIIQTNLGRAPVSDVAADAMRAAAAGYVALEMRLATGGRGGRGDEVDTLMRALTGAERTLVVNNNAAAVTVMLAALAWDREVVVSRGEAVEIGGGFRVPDVLRQSGARLVEVGTTNRTYVADYESAIGPATAALLRVHASNFAIVGFTTAPALRELVSLAHERGVLALEDAGSGCLLDTTSYGLAHEPTLAESLADGADVVCASGDKLLGGPQAGLICGRRDVVERIARHPLTRALRADKTCLAGLAATLRHYVRGEAVGAIPVWWSISRDQDWIRARVENWSRLLGPEVSKVVASEAVVGGGSLPGKTLPSFALALHHRVDGADALAMRLRTGDLPVVPRVVDGSVLVDGRTVLPREDAALIDALQAALAP